MCECNVERDANAKLSIEPIGFVHGVLETKVEAARQPSAAAASPARIELLPGKHFEHALDDIASWQLIWVIFWFHHNEGWRPKVLPPRSTTGRKGVFATRSPHRPNPIGISVVRLERVDGLTLHIRDSDMLDGTPVLDLKPYVAYTDAHPDAGDGWLKPADPVRSYSVHFDPLAEEQARWIESRTELDIGARVRATLALGPEPHPYRRIRPVDGGMQLAVKDWRVSFDVSGQVVRVIRIDSGYRASQLMQSSDEAVLQTHRVYLERWPRTS